MKVFLLVITFIHWSEELLNNPSVPSTSDQEHINNFALLTNLNPNAIKTVDIEDLQQNLLSSGNIGAISDELAYLNNIQSSTVTTPTPNPQVTPLSNIGKISIAATKSSTTSGDPNVVARAPEEEIKQVPVPKPVYIKVLQPVPQPYPVVVRQPVEVRVPVPVYVRVPDNAQTSVIQPLSVYNPLATPLDFSGPLPNPVAYPHLVQTNQDPPQIFQPTRGLLLSYVGSKDGGTYGSNNQYQSPYYQKTW